MRSSPDFGSNKPTFSVIICTYNRADLLSSCLETLVAQSIPLERYEVIVVDNNSRDRTREVVARFAETYPNVRYESEAEQGLSAARNCGVREAQGACVAFLDDECKVARDWLSQADRVRRETKAQAFGGPYEPWYLSDRPAWYKDAYGSSQDIGATGWLPDSFFVSGGNFFIERHLVQELGGFRTDLGMKGEQLGYGEETDLQIRLRRQAKGRIYYDRALRVWHCVRPEKLRPLWRLEASWRIGQQHAVIGRYGQPRFGRGLPRFFVRLVMLLAGCLVALVVRDRVRYPYFQNYLYEVAAPTVAALGRSYAVLIGEASQSCSATAMSGEAGSDPRIERDYP
jgi:glycosyltransferase involved in cell wall biosynthesis